MPTHLLALVIPCGYDFAAAFAAFARGADIGTGAPFWSAAADQPLPASWADVGAWIAAVRLRAEAEYLADGGSGGAEYVTAPFANPEELTVMWGTGRTAVRLQPDGYGRWAVAVLVHLHQTQGGPRPYCGDYQSLADSLTARAAAALVRPLTPDEAHSIRLAATRAEGMDIAADAKEAAYWRALDDTAVPFNP